MGGPNATQALLGCVTVVLYIDCIRYPMGSDFSAGEMSTAGIQLSSNVTTHRVMAVNAVRDGQLCRRSMLIT
jgi:hypothetical protein